MVLAYIMLTVFLGTLGILMLEKENNKNCDGLITLEIKIILLIIEKNLI